MCHSPRERGGGASLPLWGLKTLPCGDWVCAANKQHINSGWAVVSWLVLGLGWCTVDHALCEGVRTGTLWNVPASPPPKSPVVAPGRGFPSFVVPLGQANCRDTRVRVVVENHRAKEVPLFFMGRGKYIHNSIESVLVPAQGAWLLQAGSRSAYLYQQQGLLPWTLSALATVRLLPQLVLLRRV